MDNSINMEKIINTFEELKKFVFIVNRGKNKPIVLKFTNDNFYHLVGLHKINLDQFFPPYMKSKDKRYKYIKKNIDKFNNVVSNQFKRKDLLELRVKTFPNILNLLDGNTTSLYNLKYRIDNSNYDGDYALTKTYEYDTFCLLGLKIDEIFDNTINCLPNSWMASHRINHLVEFKKASYINQIAKIPIELYDNNREKLAI